MSKPLLVVDIDGVVLDWHDAFIEYCETFDWSIDKGGDYSSYNMNTWFMPHNEWGHDMSQERLEDLVRRFNSYPRVLKPLKNSVKYLDLLSYQYDIVALTSFTDCFEMSKFRRDYLEVLFPDVFKDVIILELGECKKETLGELMPDIYVEDHRGHAESAIDLGIETILLSTTYNQGCSGATYIGDWNDLYFILKRGEYQ